MRRQDDLVDGNDVAPYHQIHVRQLLHHQHLKGCHGVEEGRGKPGRLHLHALLVWHQRVYMTELASLITLLKRD